MLASYAWASNSRAPDHAEAVASTRDIFRTRLDRFYREIKAASWPEADTALLTAVVGEIGNNCFDHNLGQWQDVPGCWFEWGLSAEKSVWVLIADRGQGVRASLGRVDSSIKTDQDALDAAFSKILSGRSPEKRGNGLKFVKQIINGNSKRGLLFLSGKGHIVIGHLGSAAEKQATLGPDSGVPGTWALLLGEPS